MIHISNTKIKKFVARKMWTPSLPNLLKAATNHLFGLVWHTFLSSVTTTNHSPFPTPPRVNFTNVLLAAFTLTDPNSTTKLLDLTVFFALLGSACVKSARRRLMKLTPLRDQASPLSHFYLSHKSRLLTELKSSF